jgi:hypothetical protein
VAAGGIGNVTVATEINVYLTPTSIEGIAWEALKLSWFGLI